VMNSLCCIGGSPRKFARIAKAFCASFKAISGRGSGQQCLFRSALPASLRVAGTISLLTIARI
jgi:hypothetical protein